MHAGTHDTWRNLTRHEETFHDALYGHLRKTPWWFLSLAFHAVLVAALFSLDFGRDAGPAKANLTSRLADPVKKLVPEVPPPIRDTPLLEQKERDFDAEVPDQITESDHDETDNDMPFDEMLGKDGLSNAPFDGPFENPTIGVGAGGGGAFPGRGGNENLRSSGDRRRQDIVVTQGLEWLANHQDPDGYWDCDGFSGQCKNQVCDGVGHALYDPGVTGLSLLAFLGAGQTHNHGQYKDVVKSGLMYLKQVQDPEGCFGPRTANNFTYNHAIATMAMVEAYGMTGSPLLKQSAQKAVDFIHKAQNPYLAWRYGMRPGDNDTSVSGWMIMALKSAKMSHLRVDDAAFEGMLAWLDKVTEPEYGRVGYTQRGVGPARPQNLMDRFPSDRSESTTAVGVLSRIFCGQNPAENEMIRKGVDLMAKNLPVWDPQSGAVDMYYWYYGTLAMFQAGKEPFRAWNEAMKTAIIDHQRENGCQKGSWDPVGPWGGEGGRVYSTALMTMCMEVYYRYPRVPYAK